jgi:8-oxo-dGTP pyrophosphatase MutT (NUDIX family)
MGWAYYQNVMLTGEPDFNSIKLILQNTPPNRLHSTILKHSAVLILLIDNSDAYSLILTERTRNMKHHSGEISFPGGRHDPKTDKDMIDTALRECEEEIGIERSKIEILGQLDDVPTMTGYVITPVVGKFDGKIPNFTRSEAEVEQIFTIPITFFLDPHVFREQTMHIEENKFPIFMFDYHFKSKLHTIWGATAHILVEYLKKIHNYNPSNLPYSRYSMEQIEEIVKARKMKSFTKLKKIHIQNIVKGKEKDK